MARRRSTTAVEASKAPSQREMLRWSAEGVARTAVENHPTIKKLRDAITEEVVRATERKLGAIKVKKK